MASSIRVFARAPSWVAAATAQPAARDRVKPKGGMSDRAADLTR